MLRRWCARSPCQACSTGSARRRCVPRSSAHDRLPFYVSSAMRVPRLQFVSSLDRWEGVVVTAFPSVRSLSIVTLAANAAGVNQPSGACGCSVLSLLHDHPRFEVRPVPSEFSNSSSHTRPLNDSAKPFFHGKPGSMYAVWQPFAASRFRCAQTLRLPQFQDDLLRCVPLSPRHVGPPFGLLNR